jgi:ribulose-phosphate 3-epimerase
MAWSDWIRTAEVEPSLYAADFSRLGEQIRLLLDAGARVFHYDIGDGHFVPPITMGPIVLESISEQIHRGGGAVDCHLMTEFPERHLEALAAAGADSVTVHHEACDDPAAVLAVARQHGLQAGLAFKPGTGLHDAERVADGFDLVLCMSVEPGYSGQDFIPGALDRLRLLRRSLPEGVQLQVDGGIGRENVRKAREAGANLLVAATAIFGAEDVAGAYRRLAEAVA